MSINGIGGELVINGGKLRVSGGIVVNGSIAYSENATGFGGVTAQIDNDNTLNITAGKVSGVAEIDRGTDADITSVNHTNVVNNTTIHIALKNISLNKGDFIYLNRLEGVKTNYTDDYVIAPGETGMLTLRKVNGVLSLFVREMYSTNYTVTSTNPFFIKDGLNYKYPLYRNTGTDLDIITINGTEYYSPTSGIRTKSRPPKGLPELIASPTGNLAIGNSGDLTTVNYDVWGVPASFYFGSIYQGTTKKTSFILENGEASGLFTESGASSGDAYSLYVERTDVSTSDTVSFSGFAGTIAFHHDTFANSDDPYNDGTLAGATANAHIFSDTLKDIVYTWGTLSSNTATTTETTYIWTPTVGITGADVLMVAGGGGGGDHVGGGGGAGGLLHYTNQSLSGPKQIVVGNGGAGAIYENSGPGAQGTHTTFTGFDNAIGGGGGGSYSNRAATSGGSGGGGGHAGSTAGAGISGQGNAGGSAVDYGGGGGGGAGGTGFNGTNLYGAAGGVGKFFGTESSFTDFGNVYGEDGWFAGGGGGGAATSGGSGGLGGGADGGSNSVSRGEAQKHTGGGGGGTRDGENNDGSKGGSGIVLIKSGGTGKKIPKVTGISFTSSNIVFTVQQDSGTSITHVKYTVNGGSEATTPVGTLAVAHGLSASASITVVAYAVNANGDQISTKKTVSGTIP